MHRITTWDGYAEATLTGRKTSTEAAAPLLAEEPWTPPVRLARRARHRKPSRRPMLPLWAGAMLLALDAKHEIDAAARSQLAEIANGGRL